MHTLTKTVFSWTFHLTYQFIIVSLNLWHCVALKHPWFIPDIDYGVLLLIAITMFGDISHYKKTKKLFASSRCNTCEIVGEHNERVRLF